MAIEEILQLQRRVVGLLGRLGLLLRRIAIKIGKFLLQVGLREDRLAS
jgi:hypothetical protein